jgi:F-box interacting protein
MARERYLSTDVLLDILQRLPPSSRRRARLVCRHWRDAVDNGTTEMQSHAKPLIWDARKAIAYVVDDISSASKETHQHITAYYFGNVQMVSTCNGLVCLCSNKEPGGAITVVNPVTWEKLTLPPLRHARLFVGKHIRPEWDKAYNFGYHPITGRYTVLHVPCSFDRVYEFDTVHVLTLGKGSWKEVQVNPSGTKCNLGAGIISIDGTTHWITEGGSARIMCFDLEHKRVTSTRPLPMMPAGRDRYHLTEVHGRLGFAVWDGSVTTEVWVLDKETWSRWYSLRRQDIPRPYFAYGEYVMTHESSSFYGHHRKGMLLSGGRSVVHVGHRDKGTLVAKIRGEHYCYRTYSYVKTTEPLNVFRRKSLR